jgi:hypothetical protein
MVVPSIAPFRKNLFFFLNAILCALLAILIIWWIPFNIASTNAFFLAFNGTDAQATITNVDTCNGADPMQIAMQVSLSTPEGQAQTIHVDCIGGQKLAQRCQCAIATTA